MSKKKVEFSDAAKEAFKNKAFVQRLLTLETGEEVRAALKEKGIVLSANELDKFAEVLIVALEKGPKMTDDDLEKVVGGVVLSDASLLAATAKNLGGFAANSYFAKKKKRIEERGDSFGI
jgi:hypothetical protein